MSVVYSAWTCAARSRLGLAAKRLALAQSGATAVEFAMIAFPLVLLILAVLQFALVFLSKILLQDALSDASTGANNLTLANNKVAVRASICSRLIIADACASKLVLEMAPLTAFGTAQQPITGSRFTSGASGDLVVIRARAPIVSFVPLLPSLTVQGSALYMRP